MSNQPNLCDSYLLERSQTKRLAILEAMHATDTGLPLTLAEDLLKLELSVQEKTAILRAITTDDNIGFEHLLTKNLLGWSQELACAAIVVWFDETEHLLWYRLLKLISAPLVPQRVRYTILSRADLTGGPLVLKATTALEGLEDMSPAFHSLLLLRACQWSYQDSALEQLATGYFKDLTVSLHPEAKALPAALYYLRRFHPKHLKGAWTDRKTSESWRPLIESTLAHDRYGAKDRASLTKHLKSLGPETSFFEVYDCWPSLNNRSKLTETQITPVMKLWLTSDDHGSISSQEKHQIAATEVKPNGRALKVVPMLAPVGSYQSSHGLAAMPAFWEVFGGIDQLVLRRTVQELPSSLRQIAAGFVRMFEEEVPGNNFADYISDLNLQTCSDRLRVLTCEVSKSASGAPATSETKQGIKAQESDEGAGLPHRKEQIAALQTNLPTPLEDFKPKTPLTRDELERRSFLDLSANSNVPRLYTEMSREKSLKLSQKSGYFATLLHYWRHLQPSKLAGLATVARLETGPWRLCYIHTLGRYVGVDEAALKLLDFIRSDEQDDLYAVMKALRCIDTPRAHQELIASLTRPNISRHLRIEICRLLRDTDLSNLQAELRGALNDLQSDTDPEDPQASESEELRDAITTLLLPQPSNTSARPQNSSSNGQNEELSDKSLDKDLSGCLPFYRNLSSEVKRALRTARFFDIQVSRESCTRKH